jgi:hemerythrin
MHDLAAEDTISPAMKWCDSHLLGFAPLDAVHREFVDLVAALQGAPDEAVAAALAAVVHHSVEHFEQERLWMLETGFPATQCHVDEHNAVLKSLHEVTGLIEQGGACSVARDLAAALANWFPPHADYMDAALSHWMSKRTYGGAPVVVRRDLSSAGVRATS